MYFLPYTSLNQYIHLALVALWFSTVKNLHVDTPHRTSKRDFLREPPQGTSPRKLLNGPPHGTSSRELLRGPSHETSSMDLFPGPAYALIPVRPKNLQKNFTFIVRDFTDIVYFWVLDIIQILKLNSILTQYWGSFMTTGLSLIWVCCPNPNHRHVLIPKEK